MKIALVKNHWLEQNYRSGLLKALIEQNNDVFVICPPGEHIPYLQSLGITHIPINMQRSMNPLKDVNYIYELYKIFRCERFDIIHTLTTKPNIYAPLAARLANTKRVVGLVSGLGSTYTENSNKYASVMRVIFNKLYQLGFHFTDKVWFQNGDDLYFFTSKGILDPDKAVLIKGGGVDLDQYCPEKVNWHQVKFIRETTLSDTTKDDEGQIILMIARANWAKGVQEYIDSARNIIHTHPSAKFLFVGGLDDGYGAIPESYLQQINEPNFQWLGFRNDIRELLAASDIVVLPSYYREGVPRVLLEALAMGKPIVTTDHVGCRETVEHNYNGLLIPVKDSYALTTAIQELLNNSDKREMFGKRSRIKAELEFDERKVVERVINEVYQPHTHAEKGIQHAIA